MKDDDLCTYVFRSPNPAFNRNYTDFVKTLRGWIHDEIDTVICGDFNFDFWRDEKNPMSITLKSAGFNQLVKESTTIHGACLDHLYVRLKNLCARYQLHYPYYSDHEAVCFMLKKKL